jgi:tRNA (guanine26-N2/guanine27-N2)-dimethyltransferase
MSKGAQEADKCISKIGLCTIDNNKDIGPLWLGKLFDFEFLNGIVLEDKKFGTLRRIRKLLSIWKAEANAPLGYYEIDKLSKKLKISPLPLSDVLDSLQSSGYIACRTHFYPLGVKTNADITTIMSILTRLKSDRSNGSNK